MAPTRHATEAVGTRWASHTQPVPVEGVPPDTFLTFDTEPEPEHLDPA